MSSTVFVSNKKSYEKATNNWEANKNAKKIEPRSTKSTAFEQQSVVKFEANSLAH